MAGSGDESLINDTLKTMWKLVLMGFGIFASLPATTNYELKSYGFGSGGTVSQTSTYALEGTSGDLSGANSSTTNNTTKPGFIQTQQANVPQLSALDNNGGIYYNKLHFVIDSQNNPTDASYLISVSIDNFGSNFSYLQPDGTLSPTLTTTDYQTYSGWGGSSGSLIIGLLPSTTYYVRLRATQGKFTESAYGPVSSQATAAPSITFNLVTSNQTTPPLSVSLGVLTPGGSINSSASTINTNLSTNGASGGEVYIKAQNGGLHSSSTGYQINATSADLGTVSQGFGAQSTSISQTSGGPLSVASPYNGTGTVVGTIDNLTRGLYSSNAPISGGSGVLTLMAKASVTSVAASDYQEVLTFVAAGNF